MILMYTSPWCMSMRICVCSHLWFALHMMLRKCTVTISCSSHPPPPQPPPSKGGSASVDAHDSFEQFFFRPCALGLQRPVVWKFCLYFRIAIPDGSSMYYASRIQKVKNVTTHSQSRHKHDCNMVARKCDLDVCLALAHVSAYRCNSPSLICFTHDVTLMHRNNLVL